MKRLSFGAPRQFALVIGSIFSLGLITSPALSQDSTQPSIRIVKRFTVTNTNDSGAGSLRQAVLDANTSPGADEIVFNLPGSRMNTIAITSGQIEVANQLIISGPGRDRLTLTKSSSNRRLMRVNLQADVTLRGVTIADSENTNGSTIGNFGKLTIQDSTFRNNFGLEGGAIGNGSNRDSPTAILLRLQNVEFSNNKSMNGGAINNFARVQIDSSTFNGNIAFDGGGAIYNRESGSLFMERPNFTENKALRGGAILNQGELTTLNGRFISNSAVGMREGVAGGGIFNSGTATIRNSLFQNNAAGEIAQPVQPSSPSTPPQLPSEQTQPPLTATQRSSIASSESSTTQARGGGIFNMKELTLDGSTLQNNRATIGGGIFNQSTARVKSSIIRANTANSDSDVSGALVDQGSNQIGGTTGSTGS